MKIALIAALAASIGMSTAFAQQPTRVRGTIEKVEGNVLTVKAGEAGEVKLALADKAQVFGIVKATLADIKPNDFVGVGAMPQADGSQKAIQLNIFPEAMRGVGEGHRPWDRPGSTMTNGAVDTTVKSVEGQVLMVKYKDGEKKIIVTPEATIRAYQPGDRSELKPGANIATFAVKQADGSFTASRINVGREGVVPQ
ncbi:MAG TPA: hypothetical protein VM867_02905 [Xanthobacteraceae bacterium]|jgi:hypothetical protein|nr:hypothetical protein [Xanthobacteraceae bacterium]